MRLAAVVLIIAALWYLLARTAAGDRDRTFPLWGAMGGALAMGLGLALARPDDRVLVLTGDGELLMGLGSLSTVGFQQPANLAVVVLDNERYGETGQQKTHTAAGVDLAAVARACGFPQATVVRTTSELVAVREHIHARAGLLFAVVNLCRKAGVHPALALDRANAKFQRRFEGVETLAAERGLDVKTAGLEKLDALWDEVKRGEA